MTIIAWRGGTLASDSQATLNGSKGAVVRKIARNKAGDLAGATGDAIYSQAFLEWFERGEKKKRPDATEKGKAESTNRGMIVRNGGPIELYEFDGVSKVKAEYFAIGCGRSEALGAMFAGADAIGAVKAACAHDVYCGGDIQILKHIEVYDCTSEREDLAHIGQMKRIAKLRKKFGKPPLGATPKKGKRK